MVLAGFVLSTKTDVQKTQYHISAPSAVADANYKWYDELVSVSNSSIFSPTAEPYFQASTTTYYYIAKSGSTSATTISALATALGGTSRTAADDGSKTNAWSGSVPALSMPNTYVDISPAAPTMAYIISSDYTMEIGDVLYSDGAISKSNSLYTTNANRKMIGIIAYLATGNNDIICEKKKHALAISLKSAGQYKWGTQGTDENNTYFPNYNGHSTAVLDEAVTGKEKLDYILTDGHTTHKAFEACKNFNMPFSGISNSTGWFLPTVRQWRTVLNTLGNLSSYTIGEKKSDTTTMSNINEYLRKVGSGNYDALVYDCYWTSTEWSLQWTWFVRFTNSFVQIGCTDALDDKSLAHQIRPFLAF